MPVIGFFTYQPASGATTQPMLAAFRRGLTEAGYGGQKRPHRIP